MIEQVILAEDDPDFRELVATTLRGAGFNVIECEHGVRLVEHLDTVLQESKLPPMAIVSDVRMPGVSGLSVLEELFALDLGIPVILMTAFGSATLHARAGSLGAVCVLDKPFDLEELVAHLREIESWSHAEGVRPNTASRMLGSPDSTS